MDKYVPVVYGHGHCCHGFKNAEGCPVCMVTERDDLRKALESIPDRWVQSSLNCIDRALDLALSGKWSDDFVYLDARIAANYAFQIAPQLREERTWNHPQAMQFRGKIGETWCPGVRL